MQSNYNDFFIIAETAFSHEGDFDYLKQQVLKAKEGSADFVKFQIILSPRDYFVENHPSYEGINKYMFSMKQWESIINFANELELKVIILPLDLKAVKLCKKLIKSIDIVEIHSVCFNDFHLQNALHFFDKKVILGVGGRYPNEIANIINNFLQPSSEIILIQGFQSFPTDINNIELEKIKKLINCFNLPLGFADHSTFKNDDFIKLSEFAYLLGARYFEKHLVLEKGKERIDYESAIDFCGFIQLRNSIERLIKILGRNSIFQLNEKENHYRNREKQLVYAKNLKMGHAVMEDDLVFKISTHKSDVDPINFNKFVGKKIKKEVNANQIVKDGDVESD